MKNPKHSFLHLNCFLFYCRGEGSSRKVPFREAFGTLAELRAVCRENVPVLALTATADIDIASSDLPNVRLSVVKIPNKSFDCLQWLVQGLREYGRDSPKIIIYCSAVTMVGWLYEKFLFCLGKGFKPLIGMYHSQTNTKIKIRLLKCLTDDGATRVFIATSSLVLMPPMYCMSFILGQVMGYPIIVNS